MNIKTSTIIAGIIVSIIAAITSIGVYAQSAYAEADNQPLPTEEITSEAAVVAANECDPSAPSCPVTPFGNRGHVTVDEPAVATDYGNVCPDGGSSCEDLEWWMMCYYWGTCGYSGNEGSVTPASQDAVAAQPCDEDPDCTYSVPGGTLMQGGNTEISGIEGINDKVQDDTLPLNTTP